MSYTTKIGISKEEHDSFLKNAPYVNVLQSSSWADVKSSWGNERIGFYNNDELFAVCLVLERKLPLGFSMLYIPRGIATDYNNKEQLSYIISSLKKYGKKKRALFVKFDQTISYDENMISTVQAAGAKYVGRSNEMHDTIKPRFNAMLYKEDYSEETLDKKTKQFLRKARNSYPEVSYGGEELVPEFAELMKKTEERQNVHLRNGDYYKKLLNSYTDESFITLVRYNMGKLLKDFEEQLEKNRQKQPDVTNEKRLKTLKNEESSLEKKIQEIEEVIKESGELVPVAGTLTIQQFGSGENLYAGTDTSFQKYYPSYLAWAETINHAFSTGCEKFNMGGLENSLSDKDGLLRFKKNFLTKIEEYVGEFDIPVYPLLYPLAKMAFKLRKSAF